MFRIVLAMLFLAFGTSAYCQMHKWVDKDGKVNYSDTPPPQGAKPQAPAATPSQERPAQGSQVIVECRADLAFPGMAPRMLAVRIARTAQGRFQAQINGKVSNENFNSIESQVRENFDLKVDPYVPDTRNLTDGEGTLAHLQSIRDLINIPFDLRRVRKTITYDLLGRSDKYGGTVLIEAYGADGSLLGRVVRSVTASACS